MLTETYPKTVKLKDGSSVVVRPLARGDFERLHHFFSTLPEGDRLFLRHDVRDPEVVRRWTEELDFEHVTPLVALSGDEIVADGTLHVMRHGWMQHVGHIRLVTGPSHRHKGLGALITRELVSLAAGRNLEKLQAHVIEDNIGAVKMLQAVGFKMEAVLEGMVKDQTGRHRNLAVMVNSVTSLMDIMEDWIHSMTLPQFRVPGGGA